MNPNVGARKRAVGAALLTLVSLLSSFDVTAEQWYVQSGGSQVAFSPQFLTIQAGDKVTFVNLGGFHNAVADDGSFRCAHGCDGDIHGNGNASDSLWVATVEFPTPGTVGYFCEPHGAPGSGMYGTIEVLAPPPPPPAPSVDRVSVGGAGLGLALVSMVMALAFARLRGPRSTVGIKRRRR